MTDEYEKLKRAMAAPPEPDKDARARALGAALNAFEEQKIEKNIAESQGSAAPERHRGRANALLTKLFGSKTMDATLSTIRPYLMGGASVAAIAIAFVAVKDPALEFGSDPKLIEPPLHVQPTSPPETPTGPVVDKNASLEGKLDSDARISADDGIDLFVGGEAGGRQSQAAGSFRDRADSPVARSNAPLEKEARRAGELDLVSPAPAPVPQQEPAASQPQRKLQAQGQGLVATEQVAPGAVQNFAASPHSTVAPMPQPIVGDVIAPTYQDQGRDQFEEIEENPVKRTAEEPVSTFSIDVDTASYSFVRRSINDGVLPHPDAVRVEEMINYFDYDYARPDSPDLPFTTNMAVIETPWNPDTKLLHVGVQGYELAPEDKPRSNLVFLLDVSGSMNSPDKLPLLVNSFRLLVDTLDPYDTVSIVTYAGNAGTVLEPTKVKDKGKILASLNRLRAGGSTAGAEGIRQAYNLAEANFDEGGINRVILATDGDFNVGISNTEELKGFVERKRETGVFLSVLGFGRGNLNDQLMQALAQNGNGVAAYIDTLSEARKVLVEEASQSLFPIAKDVKIQIEFNPATVSEWRLVGYETRILAREDFNDDTVDAGEVGSGASVTAIYELTPTGSEAQLIDDLRYGQPAADAVREATVPTGSADEYGFFKIRWKKPDEDVSSKAETPIMVNSEVGADSADAHETRFAASVAAFGQLLRSGERMGEFGYDGVIALANSAKGDDPFGRRAEFVNLVRLAQSAAAMEPLKR